MNVYEQIVELLKEEPLFKDFKYVKSKYAFVKENGDIKYKLELEHHFTFNLFLDIRPVFTGRYEILQRWFEKFSFKNLKDQRDNPTIGVYGSPEQFGLPDVYSFSYGGADFKEKYTALITALQVIGEYVMTTFQTLEDYYSVIVKPIMGGTIKLPINGANWVFNYLSAAKILDSQSYYSIKSTIMKHIEDLTSKGEPSMLMYEGKWDEILAYLESLDFSSGKAREPKPAAKKTPKVKAKE